jgi:hypothetical protein
MNWTDTLDAIERHGWTVQTQAQCSKNPSYSYTIGLSEYRKPELFIAGLPAETGKWALDEISKRMAVLGTVEGEDKEVIQKLTQFPLVLREMPTENPMSGAYRYCREKNIAIKVLQVVFPDPKGLFPWEAGCAEEYAWLQDPIRFSAHS